MKSLIIFLIPLLLAACVTKKDVQYVKEKQVTKEVVSPEDSLMQYPCKAIPAGDSLIELAINYNKNVSCIKKFQLQLNKIRDDVQQKESSYNDNHS